MRDEATPHFFSHSDHSLERQPQPTNDNDTDDDVNSGSSSLEQDPDEMPASTRVAEDAILSASESATSPVAFRTASAKTREGEVPQRPGLDHDADRRAQDGVKKRPVSVVSYHTGWDEAPAMEPGINPIYVDLPDLVAKCVVQVVDCCTSDARFTVLDNAGVPAFLAKTRPSWSKVRWIHVNGHSWDVIKPLALHYQLHPLSLEDILQHGSASTRSKADWYKQHLFVSVKVHKTFASENEELSVPRPEVGLPTEGEPNHVREQLGRNDIKPAEAGIPLETIKGGGDSTSPPLFNSGSASSWEQYRKALDIAFKPFGPPNLSPKRPASWLNNDGVANGVRKPVTIGKLVRKVVKRNAARQTVAVLTRDAKVHIHVEQLSIFVMRDGTVVSFCQDTGPHARYSSIFDRIQSSSNLIRESQDASFVLQALLDVVADNALEIIEEFRDHITKLESNVLARPDLEDVRHLHILSAQLLLLKSTLSPFQHLLQAIRVQDDAKAASASHVSVDESVRKGMGFVTFACKIYLEDVIDHAESVMSSLDLFSSLAENLIAFTFNNLSYTSNSYMQALSVLSVIFLPLTFLVGYFGMNFAIFPAVKPTANVTYFWEIAAPVCFATVVIFSWTYISQLAKTVQRQALRAAKNRAKEL